jgi:hypothetical protein
MQFNTFRFPLSRLVFKCNFVLASCAPKLGLVSRGENSVTKQVLAVVLRTKLEHHSAAPDSSRGTREKQGVGRQAASKQSRLQCDLSTPGLPISAGRCALSDASAGSLSHHAKKYLVLWAPVGGLLVFA